MDVWGQNWGTGRRASFFRFFFGVVATNVLFLLQMVAANGRCKWFCWNVLFLLHMVLLKCPIFAVNGFCKWLLQMVLLKWPILVAANDCCKWPKFRGSAGTGLLQMTLLQITIHRPIFLSWLRPAAGITKNVLNRKDYKIWRKYRIKQEHVLFNKDLV